MLQEEPFEIIAMEIDALLQAVSGRMQSFDEKRNDSKMEREDLSDSEKHEIEIYQATINAINIAPNSGEKIITNDFYKVLLGYENISTIPSKIKNQSSFIIQIFQAHNLKQSAKDIATAAKEVADRYAQGRGCDKDVQCAKYYYSIAYKNYHVLAIDKKDPDALYMLGYFYENGLYIDTNINIALMYYSEAIQLYHQEKKISKTEEIKNIERQLAKTTCQIAKIFLKKKEYDMAFQELNQLKDDIFAPNVLTLLGDIYRDGLGQKKNQSLAKEYYKKAIDISRGSYLMAKFGLAELYDATYEYQEAFKLYNELNLEEDVIPLVLVRLGRYHHLGIQVKRRDFDMALTYYQFAEEKGEKSTVWLQADIHEERGAYDLAREKYEAVIKSSDREMQGYAYFRLALLYQYGLGVAHDIKQAMLYCNTSRALGCADGAFQLAEISKLLTLADHLHQTQYFNSSTSSLLPKNSEQHYDEYYQDAFQGYNKLVKMKDQLEFHAYFMRGWMLQYGFGIRSNSKAADTNYRIADAIYYPAAASQRLIIEKQENKAIKKETSKAYHLTYFTDTTDHILEYFDKLLTDMQFEKAYRLIYDMPSLESLESKSETDIKKHIEKIVEIYRQSFRILHNKLQAIPEYCIEYTKTQAVRYLLLFSINEIFDHYKKANRNKVG